MERRPNDDVPPLRGPQRPCRHLQSLRDMEAERDALRLELARAKAIIANGGSVPLRRGAR
jgi:hypothetical protein